MVNSMCLIKRYKWHTESQLVLIIWEYYFTGEILPMTESYWDSPCVRTITDWTLGICSDRQRMWGSLLPPQGLAPVLLRRGAP